MKFIDYLNEKKNQIKIIFSNEDGKELASAIKSSNLNIVQQYFQKAGEEVVFLVSNTEEVIQQRLKKLTDKKFRLEKK